MTKHRFPFVSIIVLNYNSKKWLRNCLESLVKLKYPRNRYEVIIADNASTDGSIESAKENFRWVKVVQFNKNFGFAEGNNRAVRYAKGEYVAFLNPDTEVDGNWLAELVKGMEKHPELASCGGKVLYLKERDIIQNAGHKMTLIGIPYPIGYCERDKGQYERARYTLATSGCAMLVRKDIFEKIGGFDKDYFLYVEEGDLGLRLWIHGYKVMYMPKAKAYHELGAWAKGKITPEHVFFYQKNIIATIIKNFELMNSLKGVCLLLIYDLVKLMYFVWNKELSCVREILRGLKCAVEEIPKNLLKRREIQKNRRISDKELLVLGLIMPINESLNEFVKMYFKNYEMRNLLTRFPLFLFIMLPLYHIGWFLHRLISHSSEFYREQGLQYFFSIEKAVIGFLLKLRTFMEKRYFIQQLRKVSDREIFSSTRFKGII